MTDGRKNSWIVLQLKMQVPVRLVFRMEPEPILQERISVYVHGSQFPDRESLAVQTLADLLVERWSAASKLDPRGRQQQHRNTGYKQRECDQSVHDHFERVIATHHEVLLDLESQRPAQIAGRHPQTGDTRQMRDHDEPPKI